MLLTLLMPIPSMAFVWSIAKLHGATVVHAAAGPQWSGLPAPDRRVQAESGHLAVDGCLQACTAIQPRPDMGRCGTGLSSRLVPVWCL